MNDVNIINEIYLNNFKVHQKLNLTFNKKFVFIVGKNATGKTSILEAISMMKPKLQNILLTNNNDLINSKINDNGHRDDKECKVIFQLTIDKILLSIENNKKIYEVNGKKKKR